MKKSLTFQLNITTLIGILTACISGICYAYSLDKRIAIIENNQVAQIKEISEVKMDSKDDFNRLESKIDWIIKEMKRS